MPDPAAIDAQIEKLQAKRAALTAAQDQAKAAYAQAAQLLESALARTATDVEAVRDLPDLVKEYIATCRDFHRIVHGVRLSRSTPQDETLPGIEAEPVHSVPVGDPA